MVSLYNVAHYASFSHAVGAKFLGLGSALTYLEKKMERQQTAVNVFGYILFFFLTGFFIFEVVRAAQKLSAKVRTSSRFKKLK